MPSHFSRRSRRGVYRPSSKGNRVARRANRVKKYARRSKGAKAQSRQIVNLSKAVSTLAKRMPGENYNLSQGLYHRLTDVTLGNNAINTSFQIIPLLPSLTSNSAGTMPAWRTWGPGHSSSVPVSNEQLQTFTPAARQGSLDLQMQFSIGTEDESPINFTVAVVTLHKDIAAELTDTALYGYDMQGMTNITQNPADKYFCRGAAGGNGRPSLAGFITFAPDKFKVLKKTQFQLTMNVPTANTLGSGQTLATVPSASRKFINWKIPMGYTINPQREQPWSEVDPSPEYVPPHNVRYLVISCDNRTTDLEYCYMNMFASTIVKGLV